MDMVVLQVPEASYKGVKGGSRQQSQDMWVLGACPGLLGQLATVRV